MEAELEIALKLFSMRTAMLVGSQSFEESGKPCAPQGAGYDCSR